MYKNLVTAVISTTRAVACFSFSVFAQSPAAVPVTRGDAQILTTNLLLQGVPGTLNP